MRLVWEGGEGRVYMLRKVKREVNSGETKSSRVVGQLSGGLQCQKHRSAKVTEARKTFN